MRTARLSSRLLAQVACWRNLSSIASLAGRLRPTTGRLAHHRRSRPPAPRVERMTHRALAPGPRLRSPSCIITRRALTFRSTRTHPPDRPLSRRNAARSSRFPKSAACIIATSGAWPEPVSPVRHCRDLPSFRPVAVPQPTLPLFPWWAGRTPTADSSTSYPCSRLFWRALWPLVRPSAIVSLGGEVLGKDTLFSG